jgi:DNA-binding transcriptional regulator YhcF (GntR family)
LKEYLTKRELALELKISTKTVQRRLDEINKQGSTKLIQKDSAGRWLIHRLAVPKFKKAKEKEYKAITIDTECDYSYKDLSEVIYYIFDKIRGKLDLNYTIETKRKDAKPHIHCYLTKEQTKPFIDQLKLLVDCDYKITDVFDLEGWRAYISKETPIITLTK